MNVVVLSLSLVLPVNLWIVVIPLSSQSMKRFQSLLRLLDNLDDEDAPIADANVMVGGQPETLVLTDENGNFALWYTNIDEGEPAIVASKLGIVHRDMSSSNPIRQLLSVFVNSNPPII